MKKYPVVIQFREILTGAERGTIKKVNIWCRYIDDVPKFRIKHVIINGPNSPSYRIVGTKLEIRSAPEIKETYEEGIL